MRVDSWALTDVGRSRKHNEDGWLIDDQLGLYAVADGMGGHAAGEVASAYGLRSVQEQLAKKKALLEDYAAKPSAEKRAKVLREVELAISVASSAIFHMAQRDRKRHGMGTTLSMILIAGNKAFMAHVGDSRIYLARANQIHQLSEDHCTFGSSSEGAITVDEAKRSPFSNVITRAVGITETVQVDTLVFDVLPGDTYLCCSDGMHGYLEGETELVRLLGATTATRFRNVSSPWRTRGGKDNITCLVLRVPGDANDPTAADVIEKLDILRRIPLFRHLVYKELVKVLNQTQQRSLRRRSHHRGTERGRGILRHPFGRGRSLEGNRALTVLRPGVHFGKWRSSIARRDPRRCVRRRTRGSCACRARLSTVSSAPRPCSARSFGAVQVLSHRLRATNEALSDAARSEGVAAPPFDELDAMAREASHLGTSEAGGESPASAVLGPADDLVE